jgi:phenylacetate-CoA ligase
MNGIISAAPAFHPEIECLPRPELARRQELLLAAAVRRARHAPFFRERLAALEDVPERLVPERFQECVPLTTKAELREARESVWSAVARPHISLLLSTSGTTGTRIPLPYTPEDVQTWHRLVARTLWTNGVRPQDVVLLPVPLGTFTGGQGMFGGLSHLGCTIIPLGPTATPVLAEALRGSFGALPTAIITLPSHLLRLLDTLPAAGVEPMRTTLRLGSLGAEAWSEAARARIEAGLGIQAVDSYGIGELCGPGVAAECAARDGLHVWEDAFFPEIVDPATGEPVAEYAAGELVLTSLFRHAFPLLRYRTGDAAAFIPGPCACGRTHRRITRILRRLDDTLIITGVNVEPVTIERILYRTAWVGTEYYLAVGGTNRDTLIVHVERRDTTVPSTAEADLTAAIRCDLPVRTEVRLYAPGALERSAGKAQRVRLGA